MYTYRHEKTILMLLMSPAKHGRHIGGISLWALSLSPSSALPHFWFLIDNFKRGGINFIQCLQEGITAALLNTGQVCKWRSSAKLF